MKKLILLSALLIFACSSDDDTTQLFLEKYDGVMWGHPENETFNFDGGSEFSDWWITFNSTGITYLEIVDCSGALQGTYAAYEYSEVWGEADSEGNIGTIQEETEDSLTIIYSDGWAVTWFVSPDGNFIAPIQVGEPEPNWDTINDIEVFCIRGEPFVDFSLNGC